MQDLHRRGNLLLTMGVERHTLKLDAHESVIHSMRGKSVMDYFSI